MNRALVALLCLWPMAVSSAVPAHPDAELRRRMAAALAEESRGFDRFDAEVWLADMSNRLARRVPERERRLQLLQLVHREARRAGLRPELVLAVIEIESGFDRYAISEAGARGLMQIMPFWLDEIGRPGESLFDVETNLRLGCTILRYYLDKERDDLTRALARYNGSTGKTWYPNRVYRALRERWRVY